MNAIKESISLINQLFEQEKLYINKDMKDFIQQIQELEWKQGSSNSSDPFKRIKGHHFDYIAALRYGIFSYYKQNSNNEIIVI
jgi:hypothetical protein